MGNPKNDKLAEVAVRRVAAHFAAAAVTAAATALLWFLAGKYPAAVETVFRPFSRFLLSILAFVTGWIPVSLAELLLGLFALGTVLAAVWLLVRLVRGPRRILTLLRFLARLLSFAASMALAFYAIWGLAYRAPPLAETMGLPLRPRETAELAALVRHLAERANGLAPAVERDGAGHVRALPFRETALAVAKEFSLTTGRPEVPVKPVLLSEWLSHLQVSGVFSPYTGEANVNRNNVASDLPFTMAHEMAHRYAIAPENEANFYAFFVLHDSENPRLAYSACLAALRYAYGALAAADAAQAHTLAALYSEAVLLDLREYSRHWSRYEGKVAEASARVYDTYLAAQGQGSGIRSYGEMVDLLLAWYAGR